MFILREVCDRGDGIFIYFVRNGTIFVLKVAVWQYTGSHSMFAESIHSVADTANQIILAFGIHRSVKNPNQKHPYGYSNMQYISSLISGVAIFCVSKL